MGLVIVTATLNGLAHTQQLIGALTRVTPDLQLRLVVVDNGSTDGTLEWLMNLETNTKVRLVPAAITLIANNANIGAGGAWNLGIRFALLQKDCQAILVVGNDTAPMPGTVERLWGLVQSGLPFVTGTAVPYDTPEMTVGAPQATEPLLLAPDFSFFMLTPACIELIGRWDAAIEFQRQFEGLKLDPPQSPPAVMNPWEWGLFDSRYHPAYFEDNDLHFRATMAGVTCLRDSGALFRHDTSLTIRANPSIAQTNQATFARNAELFRSKWSGLPHEVHPQVQSAKPLNVDDATWAQMTGGRPVETVDRAAAFEQARQTYARYGITVAPAQSGAA